MAISFAPDKTFKDKHYISIFVFFGAKRFKRSTKIVVPAEFWLSEHQKCSENRDRFPQGIDYNKALKRQKDSADKACSFFKGEMLVPSNDIFWGKVDELMLGHDKKKGTFVEYAHKYIANREDSLQHSSIKTYRSVLKLIEKYENDRNVTLYFNDINMNLYEDIRSYIYSSTHNSEGLKYSNNYFGRVIKFIKCVYNSAQRAGLHSIPIPEGLKIEDHTADTVYLTTDELMKMYAVKLKSPGEVAARDKFLLGAFTGLRISDYNSLNNTIVGENTITVIAQKTGIKTVAPLNPTAKEILNSLDFSINITDQYINRVIKEVARDAQIIDQVMITKYIAGKRVTTIHEKCDLVSSHTARRSFATNAYKSKVPTLAIMKILGHKSEKTFLKYIKISEEENAEMLLSHAHFMG